MCGVWRARRVASWFYSRKTRGRPAAANAHPASDPKPIRKTELTARRFGSGALSHSHRQRRAQNRIPASDWLEFLFVSELGNQTARKIRVKHIRKQSFTFLKYISLKSVQAIRTTGALAEL